MFGCQVQKFWSHWSPLLWRSLYQKVRSPVSEVILGYPRKHRSPCSLRWHLKAQTVYKEQLHVGRLPPLPSKKPTNAGSSVQTTQSRSHQSFFMSLRNDIVTVWWHYLLAHWCCEEPIKPCPWFNLSETRDLYPGWLKTKYSQAADIWSLCGIVKFKNLHCMMGLQLEKEYV